MLKNTEPDMAEFVLEEAVRAAASALVEAREVDPDAAARRVIGAYRVAVEALTVSNLCASGDDSKG